MTKTLPFARTIPASTVSASSAHRLHPTSVLVWLLLLCLSLGFSQRALGGLIIKDVSASNFVITPGKYIAIDLDNSGGAGNAAAQVATGTGLANLPGDAKYDLGILFNANEELEFTSISYGTITTATDSGYVKRLAAGGSVNYNTDPVSGGNTYLEYQGDGNGQWNGTSGIGYGGIAFDDANTGDSNYYNGWVEMSYDDATNTLTVLRFAYQSTLNAAALIPTAAPTAPTVTTAAQSAVTDTSATLGGNVTSDGGATVTERGIVWGTTTAPTTANTKVANGSGTGTFSATVTGLPAGTTVFVRAYATNSVNISYGNEISFTTLSNNANLSALTVTTATLNETFAPGNTTYTANVPNTTSSVTVTPTAAQANATIQARVGANAFANVTSGSPSASLALAVGANTIQVQVTAQDTTTIQTYSITVTRAAAPQNVTINVPAGVSFTLNGTTYTGTQTVPLAPGTYLLSTTTPQSLGAGIRAMFSSWSDAGAISHNVTVGSSPLNITGNFTTQYQLTTAASPGAGGTVIPASGTFFDSGTVVGVSATANSGYSFTNWTGAVANASAAATTVTLDAAKSITANFVVTAPEIAVSGNGQNIDDGALLAAASTTRLYGCGPICASRSEVQHV